MKKIHSIIGAAFFIIALISTAVEAKQIQILALGDSYTIGEGVSKSGRWPVQLKELLREEGVSVDSVRIIARSGWTTRDLLSTLQRQEIKDSYDLVTLLIGANDQFQKRSPTIYQRDFTSLLKQAVAYAGGDPGKVIVVSIPDWGVSPYGRKRDRRSIAKDINRFNQRAETSTKRLGARWINITDASRKLTDRQMYAADGLHPSQKMYKRWSEIILPEAYTIINEN